jgi:hypothetical protein
MVVLNERKNKMSVVKNNAPLRNVDRFEITFIHPSWGETRTRVERRELTTIDGETWYNRGREDRSQWCEVITCTKVDRALMESQAKYHAKWGTALD